MIIGIVGVVVIGLFAIFAVRRSAVDRLAARIIAREVHVERAKRKALAMALGDLESGLRHGDGALCAKAMHAALQVANDDTEETITKLGFKLPEKVA